MSFGYMFGWALIVEQVFNIAGMSRALLTAIFQRDIPVLQGTTLVLAMIWGAFSPQPAVLATVTVRVS